MSKSIKNITKIGWYLINFYLDLLLEQLSLRFSHLIKNILKRIFIVAILNYHLFSNIIW